MFTKELVDKVRRNFDLNQYETKVWLALLAKGSASIAEIHEISKVPRSRIYDVLKTLETKGFCIERLGRPVKYLAVKPAIVIEKLKKNVEDSSKERIEFLSKVRGTNEFTELEKLYETTLNLAENIGSVVRGRTNLLTHLSNLTKNASSKIILVSTANGLDKSLSVLMPILAQKANKGVEVTIGIANSDKLDEELAAKLKKIKNLTIKSMPGNARFAVIDNYIMLHTASEGSKDDPALWLQSDFFASTLEHLMKR